MRLMGLDVGEKTVGIALSDPLGWTAQALTTLRRRNLEQDLKALEELINSYEVEELVIGLPLNMNGSEGPAAEKARAFGTALQEATGLSIIYQDERLSTVAAQRVLLEGDVSRAGRKKAIDKVAAAYILQGYLDFMAQNSSR